MDRIFTSRVKSGDESSVDSVESTDHEISKSELTETVSKSVNSVDNAVIENSVQAEDNYDDAGEDEEQKLANSVVGRRIAEIFMQYKVEDTGSQTSNLKIRQSIDMTKFENRRKEDYGLSMRTLKRWSQERQTELLNQEESKQNAAIAKVRGFMLAVGSENKTQNLYKLTLLIVLVTVVKIQSWWRMQVMKAKFQAYRQERNSIKCDFFTAWKRHCKAEKMFQVLQFLLFQRWGKM